MSDPRLEQYARMFVERGVNVQRGWQVVVQSSPLARPLVAEVVRQIAEKGAYALVRMNYDDIGYSWVQTVDEDILAEVAPIALHEANEADAFIIILAPENTREGSAVSQERLSIYRQAVLPAMKRRISLEAPWSGGQYPTPALAQEAGMSLREFEDFLYGACLIDWEAEAARMRKYCDRFDAASKVRIVGEGTDLTLSLEGRKGMVDDGRVNIPGGEFFFSPVEDSAEGVITFSEFPAVYLGNEVRGARLVFEKGEIVEASAEVGEAALIKTIDSDAGSRRLGELGIGCNPGITRYMRNTLFDEKINGTVHLAVGAGFPFVGGTNVSSVHWDIVKDVRQGGQIFLDGELVQESGDWKI